MTADCPAWRASVAANELRPAMSYRSAPVRVGPPEPAAGGRCDANSADLLFRIVSKRRADADYAAALGVSSAVAHLATISGRTR